MVASVVPAEKQKVVVRNLVRARAEHRMAEALTDPRHHRYFQVERQAKTS